ncbi:hypothetical protein AAF712_012464 [Marasmius tenuissimus]|uniref:Uncharacterized protein n=1 Tax=Marasmius tenuissimus TaxID=585030 RepID=A0ABR2ZHF0_9AGAR
MDDSGDDSRIPIGEESVLYLSQAMSKFPTPASAIEQLRTIGHPPNSTITNSPNLRIRKACQAVASLIAHSQTDPSTRITLIVPQWKQVISRWVIFFIRHMLLVPEPSPAPPSWLSTVNLFGTCFPILFELSPDSLRTMREAAPSLQYLVGQVFLLKLDKNDHGWVTWAKTLRDLALCDEDGPPLPKFTPGPDLPRLYRKDDSLGAMLISHIRSRIFKKRRIGRAQLDETSIVIEILIQPLQCFEGVNPVGDGKNLVDFLTCIVRILKVFLIPKRKPLPYQPKELQVTHSLILEALMALEIYLFRPALVKHVIERGLVKTLFFAERQYFDLEKEPEYRAMGMRGLGEAISRVFNRMALFFYYLPVLRSFARYSRGLPSPEEADGLFRSRSEPTLGKGWSHLLTKGFVMKAMRDKFKKVHGICSCEACPLKSYRNKRDVSSLVYVDWGHGHRIECSGFLDLAKNGFDIPIMRIDLSFARLIVQTFHGLRNDHYNHLTESYRASIPSGSQISRSEQAIRDGFRNPILFLDFTKPFDEIIPAQTMNNETFTSWRRSMSIVWDDADQQHLEEILKAWDDSDVTRQLVFAWFARDRIQYVPLHIVVDYPLRRSNAIYL